MRINRLQLVNFRNYDHCTVSFDKMVTVFYGKNGQGKTNILESIFYSAFGLSHRTNKEDEMVKFLSDGMAGKMAQRNKNRREKSNCKGPLQLF